MTESKIDITKMTLTQLANHYNDLITTHKLDETSVIKFSDRTAGLRRTQKLLDHIENKKGDGKKDDGKKQRGTALYAGKKFFPKVDENPKRAGSVAWNCMKLILDKPGITYEEYMEGGGRNKDLKWDVAHDYIEARDAE